MNSFLPVCDVFLFVFWKKLKTPKGHFEIIWPIAGPYLKIAFLYFYYRATETQVKVEESSTEKTDESAVPDDIKAFYQKIDEDDDDEEESKGLILKLFKVHMFWEGHEILRNLHLTFVLCSASQK